jgi:hypothetical protein
LKRGQDRRVFSPIGSNQDPLNPPPPDNGSNPSVNWHKQKRSNDTHQSRIDPMATTVQEAPVGPKRGRGYLGHVLTENGNGVVADLGLTLASGTAEREASVFMLADKLGSKCVTLGGKRGYDTRAFVAATRELNVTPHLAQNTSARRSAIGEPTNGVPRPPSDWRARPQIPGCGRSGT